jgi:TPR repeat protein
MTYYQGVETLGIPENGAEPVRWVQRTAGQKFGPAAYVLAVMLEEGRVLPRDVEAIRKWKSWQPSGIATLQSTGMHDS